MNITNVRAVVTILFTIAVCAGFFLDKVPAEVFSALAGSAITYYFTKTTEERAATMAVQALAADVKEKAY